MKSENILIHNGRFKIADFGLASDESVMKIELGTPRYMAPEIFEKKSEIYKNKVDIWALGIIFYNLLTNEYPFNSTTTNKLFKKISTKDYKLDISNMLNWDQKVLNLLKACLQKEQKLRISIDDLIIHSVFNELKPKYSHIINSINENNSKMSKNY